MSEPVNGDRGAADGTVSAKIGAIDAVSAPAVNRIFITFTVMFEHGKNQYGRTFTTWIPFSPIIRPVVLPGPFLPRG